MKTILAVEDDATLNEGIKLTLESVDVVVIQAFNLKQADTLLNENSVDLIVLDVNLPDGNGFDFCRRVRQESQVPIIFLTAQDMELDIVRGLELGGDDYITKPFSLMVLRARVSAVLRRREKAACNDNSKTIGQEIITIDDMTLDFDNMLFMKNGQKLLLSRTEQKLLKLLVSNRGQILSRERLLDRIWDNEAEFVDEHALTVTIKRLRSKLEDNPSSPKYIKNVYGIGYVWSKFEE